MKRIIMILTAIVLLLAIGLANAKDYEITKKSGDYTIQIKIDKNPPVTGENKMDIAIKDTAGKNVTDAMVTVDYVMPAMPGMPAMNYKASTNLKGDRYTSTLNFSMSGAWTINIKIAKAGKTQTVKLNVDVK
jgi:hypothetical protein